MRRFFETVALPVHSFSPSTILDAGCGEGFFSDFLARRNDNWSVTGTDLSADAIAYAHKLFGSRVQFATANIYQLPFKDNSFDVVVCSEVLEHLDDPLLALTEIIRVARTGVVLSVPLEPYFKFFNDIARLLKISPDPGHVNFWTRQTFPEFVLPVLPRADFKTVDYYHIASAAVG